MPEDNHPVFNDNSITPERLIIQLFKLTGSWIPEENDYKKLLEKKLGTDNSVYGTLLTKSGDIENIERSKEFIENNCMKIISLCKGIKKYSSYQEPLVLDDQNKININLLEITNKCLLSLTLPPMNQDFFNVFLGYKIFIDYENLFDAVEKFNILSMYFYGDFKQAYNELRISNKVIILKKFSTIFPNPSEIKRRASYFENRYNFDDIQKIDGYNLWVLGYLAYTNLDRINEARNDLLPIIRESIEKGIQNKNAFTELLYAKTKLNRADIWKASFDYSSSPLNLNPALDYQLILKNALKVCEGQLSETNINDLRQKARNNTAKYLALTNIDVYFATSMRDPVNFTTTEEFVKKLLDHKDIKDLNMRYFDPTQSYSHDRIDKGLIECLMIKRAKVTIYNAQESDTFGKDSEAAVSLAEGKDVIVYISRLFCDNPNFKLLYTDINDMMRKPFMGEKEFLKEAITSLQNKKYGDSNEIEGILGNFAGKSDIIKLMLISKGYEILQKIDEQKIRDELDNYGYHESPKVKPSSFLLKNSKLALELDEIKENDVYSEIGLGLRLWALTIMIQLELRALVFQDGHPLGLQTSPRDSIARGVIVTRDIEITAEILKSILTKSTVFYMDYAKYAALLREFNSKSVVRIVTRNENLAKSYWSTHEMGQSPDIWE